MTSVAPATDALPNNQDNIGEIVGNYRLDKTIGQGTYGKVKLGFHVHTNDKVAIKVIEKSSVHSDKQVSRIQREIRFLKLLHHPHIVKVYDVIETATSIFIVMEYAKGGELFDYIVAQKRLKDKEARHFFRQLLSAVDYCHRNSVIHRDLKPENLLLDEGKNIKVIDFGFGNTYRTEGLLDTFCGSPFYAAPEMILGKRYEGPEVDMWSLGVILFALLCGHLPFDNENVKELYRRIASGSYRMPEHVQPSARHLISRMICVDPKKRATLDEVRNHPWVNEGYDSAPEQLVPERPVLDARRLNKDILQRLLAFGYKNDEIMAAFDDPKINPIKSTYYLLCEMLQREEKRLREERRRSMLKKMGDSNATFAGPSSASLYSISEDGSNATAQTPPMPVNAAAQASSQQQAGTPLSTQSRSIFVSMPNSMNASGRRVSAPVPHAVNAAAANAEQMETDETDEMDDDDDDMPRYHDPSISVAPEPTMQVSSSTESGNTDHHRRRFSLPVLSNLGSASARRKSTSPMQNPAPNASPLPSNSQQQQQTTSPSRKTSASSTVTQGDDARVVNGWFLNVQTTSSRTPKEILQEVIRVLTENDVAYRRESDYIVHCNDTMSDKRQQLEFEIEIVKVPKMALYGLHFKRQSGSLWSYKKLCSKLLSQMNL